MGVRRVEDLLAWQFSRDVDREVLAFTADPIVARDFDFCRQMRRSSSSARRNLAEGFGRYLPRDFARYVRIAIGELRETRDGLDSALERGYLTPPRHEAIATLTDRAIGASVNLAKYLDGCKAPPRANPEP